MISNTSFSAREIITPKSRLALLNVTRLKLRNFKNNITRHTRKIGRHTKKNLRHLGLKVEMQHLQTMKLFSCKNSSKWRIEKLKGWRSKMNSWEGKCRTHTAAIWITQGEFSSRVFILIPQIMPRVETGCLLWLLHLLRCMRERYQICKIRYHFSK